MIVRAENVGVRLVTQADHARFAADLLRLFRVEELARHPRRELLLRAVAEHDNGWWETDAAPRLDPATGSAMDFRLLPAGERQEIWRRGAERFAGESPYLAALIATHALRLSEKWRPEPSWEAFGRALELRRDEWLLASGESSAALAMDDPWLRLADSLSLAVCSGEPDMLSGTGFRIQIGEPTQGAGNRGEVAVGLAPFPFAGTTSFELACRWLEPTPQPSPLALGTAAATAPWRRDRVRIRAL